jgi:3' exoribonuclease, RNase T-like
MMCGFFYAYLMQNLVYIDTEFIQHAQGIELVSIGLVKVSGESYYAISNGFRAELASVWVQENVLAQLETDVPRKSLAQIKQEIPVFVGNQVGEFWGYFVTCDWYLMLQLYGGLPALPYNLPTYCRELRQEIDRLRLTEKDLPTRQNSHHALADAQWCREVHERVMSYELRVRN